jgi:regulator of protease activity HflC (stomatin/prohibitin superfamily)
MNAITTFLVAAVGLAGIGIGWAFGAFVGAPVVIAALLIGLSLKMANTRQKFVILRAGNLQGVKGPGLFLIIPIVDSVVAVIDERIRLPRSMPSGRLPGIPFRSMWTRSSSGMCMTRKWRL